MAGRVFTDTTDFFAIDHGDDISIDNRTYRVIGHARELRFGIEDPKFWVKRVVDTETNDRKIIKLAFFESFQTRLGGVKITCFRNPQKEGEILSLVRGHANFMQGQMKKDVRNNNVRIIDVVRGLSFINYIDGFKITYEAYFKNILPGVLKKLVRSFDAIRFLHVHGYKHGDIRNDHIIVNNDTGNFVWIDFDYDFQATDNPFSLDIYGLGNILAFAVGKGFHNAYMIKNDLYTYGHLSRQIEPDDFSLLDQRRFMNLRKLYPIIPETLNNILLHFSIGAEVYYEIVDEIIEDLNRCLMAFR